MIAISNSKTSNGIKKLIVNKNFEPKAAMVVFHKCFSDLVDASSDTWTPSASLKPSAKAIVITPSITVSLELVPISRPIIMPRVVITPETRPKLTPLKCDLSIFD